MAVEPVQRGRKRASRAERRALVAFAEEGRRLAEGRSLDEALAAIVASAASSTKADVVVARVLAPEDEMLIASAVATASTALATEIEGTRFPRTELSEDEVDDPAALPGAVRRIAERAGARSVLQVPVRLASRLLGSLELLRAGDPFDGGERLLARLAASQTALAIAAFGPDGAVVGAVSGGVIEVAGEALATGSAVGETAEAIARLAGEASGAASCFLWRPGDGAEPALWASWSPEPGALPAATPEQAARALASREPLSVEEDPRGSVTASIQLGRPADALLQLVFTREHALGEAQLLALAAFAAHAAGALRSGEQSRRQADELERTRALLAIVGQATAQLSVAHTLETAIEQVAELLHVERVAVYLQEGESLVVAAERGPLAGPHAKVAERVLELVLGRYRARGRVAVEHVAEEPLLGRVRGSAAEAGVEAVHAVPLIAGEDVIGLLAVYPEWGEALADVDSELLAALARQLAVAVQNARLHEQAKQLGAELEESLDSERRAFRRLQALNAVSGAFVESMSLETTLDVLARTVVDLLDVDAAVIRMPDARGETLVAEAIHVADPAQADAVSAIFRWPQGGSRLASERLLRPDEPLVLDPAIAAALGRPHELLVPFLERGSSAVILPVAAPSRKVMAALTLLSLDPARRITPETVETAMTVVRQAGFAIDNALLHEQLGQFTRSMQDSLLPRTRVEVEGLELGAAYESSATLEIGGDLYDYLLLEDGRLAIVLGDVTGHGVDAAADMAMAKFVFRSLVRDHPEPGDFLARVNDVICREVAAGKFVTMLYLLIDAGRGELACGSAGHPAPRLLRPKTTVEPLAVSGLALGIDPGQLYEETRRSLEPGDAVVLYTDGVVEARRNGELYGEDRLDACLVEGRALPAQELALSVLADCRRFGRGELDDDSAVVVVKRTSA